MLVMAVYPTVSAYSRDRPPLLLHFFTVLTVKKLQTPYPQMKGIMIKFNIALKEVKTPGLQDE